MSQDTNEFVVVESQRITTIERSLRTGSEFENSKKLRTMLNEYSLMKDCCIVTKDDSAIIYYNCAGHNTGCPFVIKARRIKPKNAPNYGHCFIDYADLSHKGSCPKNKKYYANVLTQLTGFQAVNSGSRPATYKSSVRSIAHVDGVILPNINRVKVALCRAHQNEQIKEIRRSAMEFKKLPSFLRLIERHNPASVTSLQSDLEHRFFRLFICLASAVNASKFVLPIGSVDGCHINCKSYNGVLFKLVMMSQQKQVVPIAMALFPKETTDNIHWFLSLCISSGFDLKEYTIFSDRWKALPAVKKLASDGYPITIKFCTEHIIKNVMSNHPYLAKQRESLVKKIYDIQRSSNVANYNDNIFELGYTFGYQAARYIAGIHPRHWVVFSNDPDCNNSGYCYEKTTRDVKYIGKARPCTFVKVRS